MKPSVRDQLIQRMLGHRRLKQSDIQKERDHLWRKQNRVCPLCNKEITKDQAVLDHSHQTGHVRAVLHRQCNQTEGRILSWIKRTGKHNDPLKFIKSLVKYWEDDYTKNPLHPQHKTDFEKQVTKIKKKIKTLKTDKGKQKYRDQLDELYRKIQETQE